MNIDSPLDPASGKRSIIASCTTTLIAIGLFYLLDQLSPDVSLAPLLSVSLLFMLSLVFRPFGVFVAFLLTLIFVTFSLSPWPGPQPLPSDAIPRFCVRIMSFCVAGSAAIVSSFFRGQLHDMLGQTRQLLSGLPVPVILSDALGRIVWANQAAKASAGDQPLIGRLYLEALPSDGTPINYDLLFSSKDSEQFVRAAVPDHQLRFVRLRAGGRRLLATVLIDPTN